MGRLVEARRRPGGATAALHVLTVQRCAAAFVVVLSYGALLWVMYSVWLRDVNPEEDLRPGPATLPVDYEMYRTSERARAERRATDSAGALIEGYSAQTADSVGYGGEGGGVVNYRTSVRGEDGFRSEGGHLTNSDNGEDFEDNLVEFESDGDEEEAFEEEEDEFEDDEEDEEDEDTEPPPNRRLLVFNSVPHTGSEVITLLLRWLSKQNGFQFAQLRTEAAKEGPLDSAEQKRLVQKMASLSDSGADGACVSHSAYIMDFVEHGAALPLRFSMIRDPIDRIMASLRDILVETGRATRDDMLKKKKKKKHRPEDATESVFSEDASEFTHDRVLGGYSPPPSAAPNWSLTLEECLRTSGTECTYLNGHQYPELTVPFFCGHHAECTRHNSRWALERAKRTVQRQFATVGVLESLNTTLAVAETLLPRYFAGAWDRFFIDLVGQIGDSMIPRSLDELSPKAREGLRANLTTEYEFYDFVKQRVEQQYNAFVPGSSS
ncbi:Heparan sulfate 2-O-sulfotransferase pipe [Amphibalanus amphitrite]|uniref:Heparan sulfate 2-O-sulfotransferase pipe n=2 Tax=Amphibalanus amphitrite TaxID=1232801 RepID=A0A6A4VDQ8_AMPAM|nr:Heparan sulfate 2-O-sulfotransferase pipe [Amphibalanus amphitrite]